MKHDNHLAEELYAVRAEIARLQRREEALETYFLAQADAGTLDLSGQNIVVTRYFRYLIDETRLPWSILEDFNAYKRHASAVVQVAAAPDSAPSASRG